MTHVHNPVIPFLVLAFILYLVFLVPQLFFILSLSKTMGKVPKPLHRFPRWLLWMLIIPLVGFVFSWIMLPFGLPKTIQASVSDTPEALEKSKTLFGLGLAMMITTSAFAVPFLNVFAIIGSYALWIIYWVKAVSIRRYLNENHSKPTTEANKPFDKTNRPSMVNISILLILAVTLFSVSISAYKWITLFPVNQKIFHTIMQHNPHASFVFISHYLLEVLHSLVVIALATIMFVGLRNAKRGIYVFTLVITGIGLLLTTIGLVEGTFLTFFYKPFPNLTSYKPILSAMNPADAAQVSHSIIAAMPFSIFTKAIQFILLSALLITLLNKNSKAWFQIEK